MVYKSMRKKRSNKRGKDMKQFIWVKPEMTWTIVQLPDGSYRWVLMPRKGK